MNSRNTTNGLVPKTPELKTQTPPVSFADSWRKMFPWTRNVHDPLLVLNLSDFNFTDGWSRTFSGNKVRQNGN